MIELISVELSIKTGKAVLLQSIGKRWLFFGSERWQCSIGDMPPCVSDTPEAAAQLAFEIWSKR